MPRPTPIRTHRSRIVRLSDGRALHARVWPGRGTPVVLLHGLLDCAHGWEALCRGTRRPCVAVDLPGFGASDLPARPTLDAYAADVLAGIAELVDGPFVLVGHSLGGGVAAAVAERQARRVRALVLLAPAGFGRIGMAEAISIPGVRAVAERVLPLALTSRLAVATAYRTMIANGLTPSDELVERVLQRGGALVPAAVAATRAIVAAGSSPDGFHRRRLPYDGPVSVVWGDRDRLVPLAHLDGVTTAFPHAATHVWAGMAHHPQRERPLELAALVESTCRRRAVVATVRRSVPAHQAGAAA